MTAYVIRLPDVGEGIAEAEIVAWHVNVGDVIVEDDPVVEVMTDKATVELPSPVTGTITKLGAEVGDLVPVGSDLIWIEVGVDGDTDASASEDLPSSNGVRERSEAPKESERPAADSSSAGAGAEMQLASEGQLAADMLPTVAPHSASNLPSASASHSPSDPASAASTASASAASTIVTGATTHPRSATAAASSGSGTTAARTAKRHPSEAKATASPAVRQRAHSLGIDLADVAGTGPGGRVVHADLDAFIIGSVVTSSAEAPSPASAARVQRQASEAIESVKIIGLRRNIAQRMRIAKNRIPHFTYVDEIDMTELERLRAQLNEQRTEHQPKLTMLPLLMRAVVVAVADFPQMNARFDDDDGVVQRYAAVHLGIASQTPKGLMVPVLKHAETHDVWSSAAEVARLSSAARAGTIKLEELSGSTITISSLGAIGGIVSTPIINYPEVAIIGVNKIAIRPVYVDGHWLPRQIMNLSSSFDHRVVDGVDAAEFIQRIKALLETPALLFIAPSR